MFRIKFKTANTPEKKESSMIVDLKRNSIRSGIVS